MKSNNKNLHSVQWNIINYSRLISKILKNISEDSHSYILGSDFLGIAVRALQQYTDEIYFVTENSQVNIQPLYDAFTSDYAAKAVGIIQKADLVFPGLLELFGKSQFLGEKESRQFCLTGTITGRSCSSSPNFKSLPKKSIRR